MLWCSPAIFSLSTKQYSFYPDHGTNKKKEGQLCYIGTKVALQRELPEKGREIKVERQGVWA